MPGPAFWIIFGLYVALNVLAFGVFVLDKRAARRGGWRTSERTLLGMTAAGGCIGAWLAMRLARHKTRRKVFRFAPFVAGTLHAAVWIAVAVRVL